MNTLELIQQKFQDAILEEIDSDHDFITSSYPKQRLATYRKTIFNTLINALALTFPGIWKLLGEECANLLAHKFCTHRFNLPVSGCLDDWGAQFPDFIHQQPALQELPYLKDYAHYEWLKHLCFCAPHSSSITQSDLELIPKDSLESLQLQLKPSVFIFSSHFPLDKIEALLENPNADTINLNAKPVHALITRKNNKIQTYWINSDLTLFISALKKNINLHQAFQQTQDKHPDFNLIQSLHFIFQNNIIASLKQ